MKLEFYVNYPGTCEDAFRFYGEALGGRTEALVRHGELNPATPAEWRSKIVHGRIEIGGAVLVGADVAGAEPMRSAYLSLTLDSPEDAERVYSQLGEGGTIFMPIEKTPFANRFAMLRDRFGTAWMLLQYEEGE